jgi:hypothetical protein
MVTDEEQRQRLERRRDIIRRIQDARKSKVICYITGDRMNLETRIAPDCHSLVFNHLRQIPASEEVDLFLYTPGGITVAGWGLVHLIREFCRRFVVLIPFKAWSCGTLICLGADEIVMGRLGQLGPIDPSTNTPFNPPIPGFPPAPQNTLPVNIEDMISFIDLAKKEIGLKSDSGLVSALDNLSKINPYAPLAVGAAHRVRPQIVKLATGLLKLHMGKQRRQIDRIVDILAKKLGSHDYLIGRKEAREIGLKVTDAPIGFEDLMWELYSEYEYIMELNTPYLPGTFLGQRQSALGTFIRGAIESEVMTHFFRTVKQVNQVMMVPPVAPVPTPAYQEIVIEEGWVRYV